jgi:hypothetical protein
MSFRQESSSDWVCSTTETNGAAICHQTLAAAIQ